MMIGFDVPGGQPCRRDDGGPRDLRPTGGSSTLQDADFTFGKTWKDRFCDDETPSTKCKARRCRAGKLLRPSARRPATGPALQGPAGFDILNTANNHNGPIFGEVCPPANREDPRRSGDIRWVRAPGPPSRSWTVKRQEDRRSRLSTRTCPANYLKTTTGKPPVRAGPPTGRRRDDIVIVSFPRPARKGSKGAATSRSGKRDSSTGEDRGDLRTFTHAVIDRWAPILVLGHGPARHPRHGAVQRGELIAYSMGNFAT